ncbi:MAG: replicative DNA helicase [Bacteroidales bacterium]|jgi:replicative DNA helicase|nr:replicative DNA helicase [Bacteroidales bacterium]
MENVTHTRKGAHADYKAVYQTLSDMDISGGKIVPQRVDFEEAVLGALMIDNSAATLLAGSIEAKMFYKDIHQYIFYAIMSLYADNKNIDLLTVSDRLRKDGKLELIGGYAYLASLTNRVASAANIEYHARVVLEKFVQRELIDKCQGIIREAYTDSYDILQLLDKAETDLFGIIQDHFKKDSKDLNEVVQKALKEVSELYNKEDSLQGVPTGIAALDRKTGGWQKSDLVIIAARPGMGKTALVLTVARNAAIDFQKPVALFSLEMSASQLVHRLFAMETGIDSEKIMRGKLSETEWKVLMEKIVKLHTDKLIIDDTPALSVFDLRAKCRRLKHQQDIQLIIVDYLQLMQGDSMGDRGKGQGNREQEISYISRSLKALAKDLEVPVIALSQLSRDVEKRGVSKRPQLSDLRESGSIEQDADMVMFIYRPEYYKMETFDDGEPSAGLAELMIQKNRHGSTEDIRVRFHANLTKFTDKEDMGGYSYDNSSNIAPNRSFDVESKLNRESVPYDMGSSSSSMSVVPDNDMPY